MTRAGSVYGEALYSLAAEEGVDSELLEQLRVLAGCFREEPDFLRLLANGSLPKERRCSIVDDSFRGRLHDHVRNFLKLLTERGHILQFFDCFAAYETMYYTQHRILPVRAVTAVPLSAVQTRRLTDKLSAMTGQQILLTNHVDVSAMGGVRLEYAGRQLDDTVRRRLNDLRSLLANTVL